MEWHRKWANIQDNNDMAKAIFIHFAGQTGVALAAIDRFITLETPFIFRKKPLNSLEESGKIKNVQSDKPRKRGTFPDDQIIIISFDQFRYFASLIIIL